MHEAEVHVFSDSVLCLGKSAMASPEIKFTERWIEHLERGSKSMNGFDKVKEDMDKSLLQRPATIESFFQK